MKFIKIKIKTQREEEKKMKNSSINKGGLKQLIDFKINLNLNKLKQNKNISSQVNLLKKINKKIQIKNKIKNLSKTQIKKF